ncbi:MAG: hypothetical protein CME61_00810 [Halobacteriovoraceae bacterium]|nr:hypothetical protein [Halobacteriovoraceae bacterium]
MNINGYVFSGECATDTVDDTGVGADKLITQLPVDVGDIDNISYFRSSAGHDASDDFEDCRSMKHYIEPITKLNDTNNVYSPFDGIVISMTTEEGNNFSDDGKTNQRISIRPTANPAYEVTLYHVDVLSSLNLTVGTAVNAGDHLGYGRLVRINSDSSDTTPSASNDFDIQAKVLTPSGIRAVSVFQLMEDSVFTSFSAFGSSVSDFIITKSQRDADALTCEGETFTSSGSLGSWILP